MTTYYPDAQSVPRDRYRRLQTLMYDAKCDLCHISIGKGAPAYWAKRAIRQGGKVKSAVVHEDCWFKMDHVGPVEESPVETSHDRTDVEPDPSSEDSPVQTPKSPVVQEQEDSPLQPHQPEPRPMPPLYEPEPKPEPKEKSVEELLAERVAPIVKKDIDKDWEERFNDLQNLGDIDDRINKIVAEMAPVRVVHDFKNQDFTIGSDDEDEIVHPAMPLLVASLQAGHHTLLHGPAGTGKTYAARLVIKKMGRTLFVQTPVYDAFELRGFRDATGVAQPTTFTRWAKSKGAVIIFDEVDGSNPDALLPANLALENGCLDTPDELVEIDESNLVIATANTALMGATTEYTARKRLDIAFASRFKSKILWEIDQKAEAAIAIKHHGGTTPRVKWSQKMRKELARQGIDIEWSPRSTFAYCRMRAVGLDHENAIKVSNLSALEDKAVLKSLAESIPAPE